MFSVSSNERFDECRFSDLRRKRSAVARHNTESGRTPGGPTTAIMTGGGSSSGVLLTSGTCSLVWSFSAFRLACFSARLPELTANAYRQE